MSRLSWGNPGDRVYLAGTDRGVLYTRGAGVPWIGLTAVREAPAYGTPTAYYVDGRKYLNESFTPEEYTATLEAYTYPDAFELCDGTATTDNGLFIDEQYRESFDLSYRTNVGNDLQGLDFGYRIHCLYNATAAPSTKDNVSVGSSVTPMTMSWALTTLPEALEGYAPVSHLIMDSRYTDPKLLEHVEGLLYGTPSTTPRLPRPNELLTLFQTWEDAAVVPTGYGMGLYGAGRYGGGA